MCKKTQAEIFIQTLEEMRNHELEGKKARLRLKVTVHVERYMQEFRTLGTLLIRHKLKNGIPQKMHSCHTGKVEGYMIEGHVPPADIRRLLDERPDAIGLAVPGMPYGSPGMGPENEREAYDVFLIRKDGSTEVFASYESA